MTLCEGGYERTVGVLATMGFRKIAEQENRFRFAAEGNALGNHIDVLVQPQLTYGRMGAGSVHHIAFRASDDAAQLEWRKVLAATSLDVTPVLDRTYFHSIYFREPGGVLFEIATDPPGSPWMSPSNRWVKRSSCPLGWSGSARAWSACCLRLNCTLASRRESR